MGRTKSVKKKKQEQVIEQEFHLREVIDQYLVYWKWFLLCVSICLLISFTYLRYAIPQYKAVTTILVKDENKGGMLSELSAFKDLGLTENMKNNVDNEIEILKSRTLVESTVKKLNLNQVLNVKGSINDIEIYKETPITVTFINKKSQFYLHKTIYDFHALTNNTFELQSNNQTSDKKLFNNRQKVYRFGDLIETEYADLIINKTNQFDALFENTDKSITINVSPIESVVDSFFNRLEVKSISKTSSVVTLSLIDPNINKAEDFLNNLVQIYNENAISDKNFISEKTSEFIVNRLKLITQELGGVEQDVESFKETNNLIDIDSEAKLFIEGSSEYNKKVLDTEIQLKVVFSLLEFMKKSNPSELLPTNIITGDNDASSLISTYNQLILDRNRILKTATDINPAVLKLDQQIASLKSNVASSLNQLKSNLLIQKRNLKFKEGVINSKIGRIPNQERKFKDIERQQKVKEGLYLYLLQKREETAISLAATEANAKVIDLAKGSKNQVSPKRNMIYLASILLGLLIPFGTINIIDLLDTKIKSRLDLEGETDIPFIGDLPTSNVPHEIMKSFSRTSTAEALRIIRSNLEFMVNKDKVNGAKTFFITSSFPHEGKSFVSANLSATFAMSGKKVLLIEMDIRSPKLHFYFKLPKKGVSNYLSSNDLIEDIVVKQKDYDNFYIIPAGVIPPNPSELLMNEKVEELFKSLKSKYDYIFVDTAPVGLVADTHIIAKNADCFIYVFRANYLSKRMLNIANSLYKEKKLPNMCLLLNDTDSTKGYGYGYGYGAVENKIPWYKIFNKG